MTADSRVTRLGLRIRGTVQGVGFRPFVYRLANELGLTGEVSNDAEGVWVEIEGPQSVGEEFVRRVKSEAPPLSTVATIEMSDLTPIADREFIIRPSTTRSEKAAGSSLIPADVAACAACLRDVADPSNRRHRYPFTCCTDCGPRFTVVDDLPYDRASTSMVSFPPCPACCGEYEQPDDRRFHAQAICCAGCGPQLQFVDNQAQTKPSVDDPVHADAALAKATALLRAGGILAVKGLGGYQLLCRADDADAVQRLRDRKHRDQKPFAVLVETIDHARVLASFDKLGTRALLAPEAPIVLAPAKPGPDIANQVAPGTGLLGVMLPASPLHAILTGDVSTPLVCTSGNQSGAPIIIDDDEALDALANVADAWLMHDRRIARRADDSVGQVVAGRFQLLRRARGFAPRPVSLAADGPPILAVGAELKSTVCLAVGAYAGVSVHLGDLENPQTIAAFESAIGDQLSLAGTMPELIVHDIHPEYLSSKFAMSQDLAPTLAVQHHHAHLVSCLVDNSAPGPAIGVIFDGLGWGIDDTAWGGEFLVGDASGFERHAHLGTVPLPGGSTAIREPWRMAVSHLLNTFGSALPAIDLLDRHPNVDDVVALCASSASIHTSSIGRLFDAVAALCAIGDVASYEGQAAIGLEQIAAPDQSPYPWAVLDDWPGFSAAPVIDCIVEDLANGRAASLVAGRFHSTVASMIATVCARIRDETGISTTALSGGVFQNRLLVELVVPLLEAQQLQVLRHGQVPPNDGGISLGQVAIGRAHLRSGVLSS